MDGKIDDGFGNKLRIQLIDSHFGTPQDLIGNFDLHNSMVGFDLKNAYVAEGWKDLEEKKLLALTQESNQNMLGWRFEKYIMKYGYKSATPETQRIFHEWFMRVRDNKESRGQPGWLRKSDEKAESWIELNRCHAILRHIGLMDSKYLPDFVGYFHETRRKGSVGPSFDVDLAMEALENRNASQNLIDIGRENARTKNRVNKSKDELECLAKIEIDTWINGDTNEI